MKHFSFQLHVGRSLAKIPNYFSPDQKIPLARRKIYSKVAAEVPSGYTENTVIISVRPEYRYKLWIKAKNTTKGARDAMSKPFCDLPWHNLNVKF
jgi:hypothetical protein